MLSDGDVIEFMTNGAATEYWVNPFSATGPASDTASPGALSTGLILALTLSAAPLRAQDTIKIGEIASLTGGRPGVLHGNRTYLLQDANGQITETHSISAGLDYPGVGPEHAWLKDTGRAEYRSVTDDEAMSAFQLLSRTEGIIPAIESAHAVAGAIEVARELAAEKGPDATVLINLSGRGDKDMGTATEWFKLGEPDDETGDPE